MSWKDIKPGKHIAKATRARFDQSSQKGTVFIEVEFELNETKENLRWRGFLTEKTIEKTMEVMALLDWNNDENFGPGSINTAKDVQLVVELEPDANDPTKEYPRVRWVNDLSGGKFTGMEPAALKEKLGGVNLKAEMAAARQRLGLKAKEPVKNHAPGASDENVPF